MADGAHDHPTIQAQIAALTARVDALEDLHVDPTPDPGPSPPPPDPAPLPPSAGGSHDYFKALRDRSDVITTFSLRDQAQLNAVVHGPPPSTFFTYGPATDLDPRKQDAAKLVLPGGTSGLFQGQLRIPIGATAGPVLITWDSWWGSEFVTDRAGLKTHKAFQLSPAPDTRFFEVRSLYFQADAGQVARVDVRPYSPFGPTTHDTGPFDRLEPIVTPDFMIAPETWTRYWLLMEMGSPWDLLSLWMADEVRDAVQIYDQREMDSSQADNNTQPKGVDRFWFEWNSSQNRTGGPLVAYVRNLVALATADVAPLLVRPT